VKSLSARSVGTSRTATRLGAAVAVGATAATLLGGCGFETRQQAAAVVNGTVIHESDVQETHRQLAEAKFDTSETAVVMGLVAAPLLDRATAASGGWKPDASYAQIMAQIPDATDTTKQFVAAALFIESPSMTQDVVAKYRNELNVADVSVNPKFGEFSVTEQAPVYFTIGQKTPNWIKPSAASP
jgi:hypothetical protein